MFLSSRLRSVLVLLILCGAPSLAQAPEYRASWADAFHTGYLSQSAVTTTVANLRGGNVNVFVPEIYVNSGSQLIYWKPTASEYPDLGSAGTIVSNGVQISCDLNSDPETLSSGSFDPLAESIRQCHDTSAGKARLDVWAWMVSFRSSGPLPAAHPEWITVNSGGSSQTDFDPGHPGSEQQLVNTCLDIVKHYDVDGLNFDYIRFTDANNGFNPVSIARYRAITKNGDPTASDAAFKQWRRDQITNVVRKIYLNVIAVKPNVKISADTITWSPGPTRPSTSDPNPLATWKANFQAQTSAYLSVYQDWRSWMEEGILDIAMPMNYFSECSYKTQFDKWSDFTKDIQYGRQAVIGPGGYLNSLADALAQFARTRDASSPMGKYAAGQNNYSYAVPYAASCGGTQQADPVGWLSALKGGMYSQTVPVPALPRLTNGKGHIKGTVVNILVPSPGWVDGGTVSLSTNASGSSPIRQMSTDGTGFYGFVDVAPGSYFIKVHAAGVTDQIKPVTVTAAAVSTVDFSMSIAPPATMVEFAAQPGGAFESNALNPQPAVVVKDASGNVAPSFTGVVSLAITPGTGVSGAVLSGTTASIPVNGVASFSNLSIDKPGAGYTLTATSTGLASATSTAFNIDVTPARLAVLTQPAASKAGQALPVQPVIVAQDDSGNTALTFNGPVSVSIITGTGFPGASLGGTVTINAVNGIATFTDLSIDKVGFAYRLTASSGSLTPVDTVAFDIGTTAVKLAFETQPGGAKAGKVFSIQPVVVAQSASGGVAADYIGNADVSIEEGTGAATALLDGTTSIPFVNGRAAFTDLAIGDPGGGYILTAGSGTMPSVDSSPFDVVYGGPFTLADAIRAASIWGGLSAASSMDLARLDVEQPEGMDLLDAIRILRKASGLEPNP